MLLCVDVEKATDCFEWGVEYHGGGLEDPMVTGVTSPDSCQNLCQMREGCQYFAWVNSQHDVINYRNTCWLKGPSFTKQPCDTCVSGPRDCGDQVTTTTESNTGCCQVVTIASSGDTVDYQWNRLGVFSFQYSSPDGRPVYYMSKHDQWLYYVDWLGVWYVNDTPLENMGGIINWSDAFCPEDIQEPWSFYRWGDGEIDDWEEDPYLKVTCGGNPDPPKTTTTTTTRRTTTTTKSPQPGPDPCSWGSACDGCQVTNSHGGVTYCCASGCDWGDVWVWDDENGVTQCTCSHIK